MPFWPSTTQILSVTKDWMQTWPWPRICSSLRVRNRPAGIINGNSAVLANSHPYCQLSTQHDPRTVSRNSSSQQGKAVIQWARWLKTRGRLAASNLTKLQREKAPLRMIMPSLTWSTAHKSTLKRTWSRCAQSDNPWKTSSSMIV